MKICLKVQNGKATIHLKDISIVPSKVLVDTDTNDVYSSYVFYKNKRIIDIFITKAVYEEVKFFGFFFYFKG